MKKALEEAEEFEAMEEAEEIEINKALHGQDTLTKMEDE